MAERKLSTMQKIGLGMAAFGQGMTGQPYASNIMNGWQKQDEQSAEQEYKQWQMKQGERELATQRQKIMMDQQYKAQMLKNGMPIYTMGADGPVYQGSVPNKSKVITPEQMMSPDEKIELQAKGQAAKEQQMNIGKVKRLYPIIDTIEKEWLKTQPSTRAGGITRAMVSPLQLDKNVSSYQTFTKGMRAQLARAMGDVGNLSEPEQKAAMELVPKVSDSKEVGEEKLKKIRVFISNLEAGNSSEAKGLLGQTFTVGGKTYNIPPDKIEAFKKAKGIK